ncbi:MULTISPECIES: SAM-dependent methyltransferase [unclassified Arthrobacter]|uniref:SAM-dependent methyltransferase n=1 Tax=unclassified Arthrobacter TaxID=235627 RepID=UPI002DF86B40|nr:MULTISPECIES: class I SAM-dependent methyltransferase [unclassified Arthrobacter]MEC5191401.1 SAM-dependent methyltransferase [Arthrobacter sp. MP_M4]MEC5202984.1 SAM-dependent methyltransferase [Arthrobacter sp. MP_M7]
MTEHEHSEQDSNASAAQVWDEKYRSRARVWSGEPNPQLIAEAAALPAGAALDLGCGEGADAIWLASRGWTVTAVDVSAVALERAEAHARDRGQSGNITWVLQDLATWVPEELFDLVTAQFLHSTVMPWQQALQLAAAAVRTGGTLLIVGHHPDGLPPWTEHHEHAPERFYTAETLARELGIEAPEWRLDVVDTRHRSVTGPDGEAAALTDAVLRATRLAAH